MTHSVEQIVAILFTALLLITGFGITTNVAAAAPAEETNAEPVIRVGLIRCDTHGVYFAALMHPHDPLGLRGPNLIEGEKPKYSWQSGAAHFTHYTQYDDATRMTSPSVSGFKITKVWDEYRPAAELFSKIFEGSPKVCDTFEEVSDDVDLVFIADCNYDGSDHLKLAAPGLKKGVPTFIDKPFAYTVKDAVEIVRLAKENKAPLASFSILRTAPRAERFSRRLDEAGRLNLGIVIGGGPKMDGQIHAISLAQHVFGGGVESVSSVPGKNLSQVILNYGRRDDRPEHGVVLNFAASRSPKSALYASVYGREATLHSPPIDNDDYPKGAAIILEKIKKMVQTGEAPAPYDELIENIAVAEAARRAHELARAVKIVEVWPERSETSQASSESGFED